MKTIPATDMLGRKIKKGDVIAYALTCGRSANLALYQVEDLVNAELWNRATCESVISQKIRAKKLKQSYGMPEERLSTLAMCNERALIVNDSVQLEKL